MLGVWKSVLFLDFYGFWISPNFDEDNRTIDVTLATNVRWAITIVYFLNVSTLLSGVSSYMHFHASLVSFRHP